MSKLYNYEYYHENCGPIPYEEPEAWVNFFGMVADRIVKDLNPRTVLDAGCAMGYLVAALRDRGVEAYGLDISDYAISMVREDIKPYCAVGSLLDSLPKNFPEQFDLVTNIEVLEHLYAEDGKKAIENLCAITDCIIFSSTPNDFTERTHVNVQQREYWARLFASAGFYDDLDYRPTYLTYYAVCYRRKTDWLRQIEDYERNICMTEDKLRKTEDKLHTLEEINKIPSFCKVYFDCGSGLSEENCFQVKKEIGSHFQQRIILPEGCTFIRFDPVEGSGCLIWNLQVRTESSFLQVRSHNGVQLDDVYVFRSTDPQIYFDVVPNGSSWVDIDAEIIIMDHSAWIKMISEIESLEQQRDIFEQERGIFKQELVRYENNYLTAISQRDDFSRQLAQVQDAYNVISNATFWKMTGPLRAVADFLKRLLRSNRYTRLFYKGLKCLKENGVRYTWKRVKDKVRHRQDLLALMAKPLYTQEELDAQRTQVFPRTVKFSIAVPLYNTPKSFLHEMIRSVLDQTYGDWELCMADGSDQDHAYVGQICQKYARKDKRVIYRKLDANMGISENTNACIDMATGDYIGLLDHDDLLHPAALYDVMTEICEKDADFVYTDEATFESPRVDKIITLHFKPDFAIDNLRAANYICHFTVFKKTLLDSSGKFRPEYDGSQDHDLMLRLTPVAKKIVHIPKILYYWRAHSQSTSKDISVKEYAINAGKNAVRESIKEYGYDAEVSSSRAFATIYKIRYELKCRPKVSIIIPNKNHLDDLSRCVESILTRSSYDNYEIVIVDNGSDDSETLAYYNVLKENPKVKVCSLNIEFNYPRLNNFGAEMATGEYYILLNNDVEVISREWIEEMLMYVQRDDVAAAGAMLYFPNDTIQHAGVILGLAADRVAGHAFYGLPRGIIGYMGRLCYAQNMSAVTSACMMVKASAYWEVEGFSEEFKAAYSDIDFCMKLRKAGYLIVWTPYAELYHHESKSLGGWDTPEKRKRFDGAVEAFHNRWAKELAEGDPYYNPNFTLDRGDFSLKQPNET